MKIVKNIQPLQPKMFIVNFKTFKLFRFLVMKSWLRLRPSVFIIEEVIKYKIAGGFVIYDVTCNQPQH